MGINPRKPDIFHWSCIHINQHQDLLLHNTALAIIFFTAEHYITSYLLTVTAFRYRVVWLIMEEPHSELESECSLCWLRRKSHFLRSPGEKDSEALMFNNTRYTRYCLEPFYVFIHQGKHRVWMVRALANGTDSSWPLSHITIGRHIAIL